jgi:glycosyltransferase involved in cell wall biosynthesis
MNLASVVVATYNSSEFVLETLESIKKQTYSPIELIVSDDGSQDNTVELARTWLVHNESRFVRTEVVTVPKNTGVSANCNRCIQASCAEWIKLIAGDDILLPNCIADNMNFVEQHPETKILFSYVRLYRNNFNSESYIASIPGAFPSHIMAPHFTPAHQFKLLLLSDRIHFTPSYFFQKEALLSVGGYDEQNNVAEDYPMWLKLTKAGIRLDFMEYETVGYRQHDKAINNINDKVIFKPLLLKMYSFRKKTVFPHLPWDIVAAEKWATVMRVLFARLNLNKQTPVLVFLYRFATIFINPFQYVISFRKKILSAGSTNVFYANS